MESGQTTEVLIGRVLERLDGQDRSSAKFELDIKSSLKEIKDQTVLTNGRVTAIEKQNVGWEKQLSLIKYLLGGMGAVLVMAGVFFGSSLKHLPFLDQELTSIHSQIDTINNSTPSPTPIQKKR